MSKLLTFYSGGRPLIPPNISLHFLFPLAFLSLPLLSRKERYSCLKNLNLLHLSRMPKKSALRGNNSGWNQVVRKPHKLCQCANVRPFTKPVLIATLFKYFQAAASLRLGSLLCYIFVSQLHCTLLLRFIELHWIGRASDNGIVQLTITVQVPWKCPSGSFSAF